MGDVIGKIVGTPSCLWGWESRRRGRAENFERRCGDYHVDLPWAEQTKYENYEQLPRDTMHENYSKTVMPDEQTCRVDPACKIATSPARSPTTAPTDTAPQCEQKEQERPPLLLSLHQQQKECLISRGKGQKEITRTYRWY